MPGKLIVGTIETQNINFDSDTTSMVINSTGHTRLAGNPCFGVRGVESSSGSNPGSSTRSAYREVTDWTSSDVDIGGMLVNGRLQAPVTGVYHFYVSSSATPSFASSHRLLEVYKVVSGTFTLLHQAWTASDYGRYTLAFNHFMTLNAGEQISVGWDDAHPWNTSVAYSSFSGMLIG